MGSHPTLSGWWTYLALTPSLTFMLACSAPGPKLTGSARAYAEAKDAFNKGNFDRALELTDKLAYSSPPEEFTQRARVLRAAILSGTVSAYKELAEAYEKGSQKAKQAAVRGEYRRLRQDNFQLWSKRALALAEVAQQLTTGGTVSKEFILDAPYPSTEGSTTIPQLNQVMDGNAIGPEEEEAAAVDAQRKGLDDALAEILGGDRSKARAALRAGPAKVSGVDVALFLARQLLVGAEAFDRKHGDEPTKFMAIQARSQEAVKAALAQLKQNPNADREKEAKKLQERLKSAMKTT
jgi:hypothetical protein